ncbi:MAG: hypothetical protein ACE5GV_11865, partial [Candidatus Scalindua sp.]
NIASSGSVFLTEDLDSNVQESVDKLAKANEKVTAAEKSNDAKQNYRQAMMKSQNALRSVVKGLKEAGVGKSEVSNIIKTANREANKVIGTEMRQAYNDYRGKKINRDEFANRLYGAATKKLDSIVSALKDALAQKTVPADKNTEAVKENANATKGKETNVADADSAAKANAEKSAEEAKESTNETVAKADDDDDDDKKAEKSANNGNGSATTPPGLIVKAEKTEAVSNSGKGKGISGSGPGPINGSGNEGNVFAQIVDIFNGIDKIINGFADKVEGEDSNVEDKGQGLVNFASRLSDMFSGINRAFGNQSNGGDVGNKLGIAQVNKETISQLFDSGHGSGVINSIGDAGEGSGNFNAASFMSSLSNSINDGLERYEKEMQKAENKAKEEAVSTIA